MKALKLEMKEYNDDETSNVEIRSRSRSSKKLKTTLESKLNVENIKSSLRRSRSAASNDRSSSTSTKSRGNANENRSHKKQRLRFTDKNEYLSKI